MKLRTWNCPLKKLHMEMFLKNLSKKKDLSKKKPSKMVQRVDELEKLVNRQEQYSRIHDVFVFQCIE